MSAEHVEGMTKGLSDEVGYRYIPHLKPLVELVYFCLTKYSHMQLQLTYIAQTQVRNVIVSLKREDIWVLIKVLKYPICLDIKRRKE